MEKACTSEFCSTARQVQKLWMRKKYLCYMRPGKAKIWCTSTRKSSLDCAIDKAKLTVDRKSREIGLGSDGTNTNKALYRFEKEEICDHLILVLCISHKLELAIHDAFTKSKLNNAAEEQLVVTYYLFKRANLKWRLFKRHALLANEEIISPLQATFWYMVSCTSKWCSRSFFA